MIKVYVYVTGLVLYQFTGDTGGLTRVLLPAGGFDYPGLGHVHPHRIVTDSPGAPDAPVPGTLLDRIAVACTGNCKQEAPKHIADLVELGGSAAIREECRTFAKVGDCKIPGTSTGALSGLLELVGDWEVLDVTDCGGAPPDASMSGSSTKGVAQINFIRPSNGVDPKYRAAADLEYRDGVVFHTDVQSLQSDLTWSGNVLKGRVFPLTKTQCANLPGFDNSYDSCAVLMVRNGTADPDDKYRGGGDLHFGSFYAFGEGSTALPADPWLPTSVAGAPCPQGAGCGGLRLCMSAMIQ